MAYWLVTILPNKEKIYKCSNCGVQYFNETIFGPEGVWDKCPNCGEKITGSAVDHSEKYTKEKVEEMFKIGEETQKLADACKAETESEKIKRIRKEILDASGPGTYERYLIDITKYLQEKFPDEDSAKTLEAAGYISNRTQAVLQDMLIERDKMWDRHVQEMKKHYEWRSRKFRGDIREED